MVRRSDDNSRRKVQNVREGSSARRPDDRVNDESNYGPIWLDVRGSPLTNAGKVTERFTRPNYGTLEIQITVDDPKAYTRPWTVRVTQRIAETELNEFICEDRDASHYVGPKQ